MFAGLFFIAIIVIGAGAGWFASLVYGDTNKLSWPEMTVIGLLGSLTGGLLLNVLFGNGLELQVTGMIGAILGSLVVLPIFVWLRGRADVKKDARHGK